MHIEPRFFHNSQRRLARSMPAWAWVTSLLLACSISAPSYGAILVGNGGNKNGRVNAKAEKFNGKHFRNKAPSWLVAAKAAQTRGEHFLPIQIHAATPVTLKNLGPLSFAQKIMAWSGKQPEVKRGFAEAFQTLRVSYAFVQLAGFPLPKDPRIIVVSPALAAFDKQLRKSDLEVAAMGEFHRMLGGYLTNDVKIGIRLVPKKELAHLHIPLEFRQQ